MTIHYRTIFFFIFSLTVSLKQKLKGNRTTKEKKKGGSLLMYEALPTSYLRKTKVTYLLFTIGCNLFFYPSTTIPIPINLKPLHLLRMTCLY